MFIVMMFMVFALFIFGFLLDISINVRRVNNNIKKLIK